MSKLKDETGKTYGYLTVIERAENAPNGRARWLCKCKCGNTIVTKGEYLRNGDTKSCGCYNKEQTSKASTIDLKGQTIGNFTILEKAPKDPRYHDAMWRCKCNLCGATDIIISSGNLKKQYSCGCSISSKGERKIQKILNENNIKYIKEKQFSDCTFVDTGRTARFDFYLPEYNCLIEYDGVQHFIQRNGVFDNQEKFKITQEHDKIKIDYAKEKNINLIRIPYTHYDNLILKDLLPKTSNFLLK